MHELADVAEATLPDPVDRPDPAAGPGGAVEPIGTHAGTRPVRRGGGGAADAVTAGREAARTAALRAAEAVIPLPGSAPVRVAGERPPGQAP